MDFSKLTDPSESGTALPPAYSPASNSGTGTTQGRNTFGSNSNPASADTALSEDSKGNRSFISRLSSPYKYLTGNRKGEADAGGDLELGNRHTTLLSPTSAGGCGGYSQPSRLDNVHINDTGRSSFTLSLWGGNVNTTGEQSHLNGNDSRQDEEQGFGGTLLTSSNRRSRSQRRSNCGEYVAWTVIGGVATLVIGGIVTATYMGEAAKYHWPPFDHHPSHM